MSEPNETNPPSDASKTASPQSESPAARVARMLEDLGGSPGQSAPAQPSLPAQPPQADGGSGAPAADMPAASFLAYTPDAKGRYGLTIRVMNGTTTSQYDRDVAAANADLQQRWDDQAAERALSVQAPKGKEALEHAAAEAAVTQRAMTFGGAMNDAMTHAVIEIPTRDGSKTQFCIADIIMEDLGLAGTGQALLVIVCPRCVSKGRKQAYSQLKISDKNRAWYLDTKTAGAVFINPDDGRETITAGRVELPSTAKCPNEFCNFKFRISANNPMYPMCSLMYLE